MNAGNMKERLQKLLAQANIASRRASEDLITRGRVRVNGAIAHVGDKADPETDGIEVDGVRLNFAGRERIFIALNKPKHVLTTDKPHRTDKRQTVTELIGRDEHLFSIGRLDADSEGLVVMTNDGDTAQRLSHPRYRHSKTYRVEVFGLPTAETIEKWRQGIFLEEGKTAPCIVEIVKGSVKGTTLRIVMTEGKKRQIRRVAAALGHPVERLVRTHLGMFALGDLAPGASRTMTPKEIMALSTPSPEIKSLRAQTRAAISAKRATTEESAGTSSESKPKTRREYASNPRRAARLSDGSQAEVSPAKEGSQRRITSKPSTRRTRKPDAEASSADQGDEPRRTARPARDEASAPRTRSKLRFQRPDPADKSAGRRRLPRRDDPETGEEAEAPRRPGRSTPDASTDQQRRKPAGSRPPAASRRGKTSDSSSEDRGKPRKPRPAGSPVKQRGTGAPRTRKPGGRKGGTR